MSFICLGNIPLAAPEPSPLQDKLVNFYMHWDSAQLLCWEKLSLIFLAGLEGLNSLHIATGLHFLSW